MAIKFPDILEHNNPSLPLIYDKWIYYEAETVNRTIYIATTGSDTLGDGSSGLPFLTIGKALSSIKKTINSGITVTISIGAGTFSLSAADAFLLSQITGEGTLLLQGTFTLVESGFSLGAVIANDAQSYAVSGGNTATWTTNQWQYYFIKQGLTYVPITANSTTQISAALNAALTAEIYQCQTSITFVPQVFTSNVATSFYYLEITLPTGTTYTLTTGSKELYFKNCYINYTSYRQIFLSSFAKITITQCAFKNVQVAGNYLASWSLNNTYIYINNNSGALVVGGESFLNGILSSVFENPNTGTTACCIDVRSKVKQSSGNIKIVNSNLGFLFRVGYEINFIKYSTSLILLNTNYLARKVSAITDYSLVIFTLGTIYGTPVTRWFYDPMYEFINLASGRNIQITGIIFPEIENNLSATLTDNATTNVIVGNKLQNKSITIEYTLTRGTGYRKGRFDIINDGTSLYMSPDSFITNGVAGVDDPAITFAVNYNTNEIRIAGTLDNSGGNATLNYNVSRVMITPLTI